jgi:hypothetical protein
MSPPLQDARQEDVLRAELLWAAASGELLGGLTHALSNRVGTLMAVADHLGADAGQATAVARLLDDECTRLAAIVELLRILPPRRLQPPEAISVAECMDDAVSLLRYHPESRNITPVITGVSELPSAWGRRNKVRRAFILSLLAALPKEVPNTTLTLPVACSATDSTVTVSFQLCSPLREPHLPMLEAVQHYARLAGAECRLGQGEVELRLRRGG